MYNPVTDMLRMMDIGYRIGQGLRPDLSREAQVGLDEIEAMQEAYKEEEREEVERGRCAE